MQLYLEFMRRSTHGEIDSFIGQVEILVELRDEFEVEVFAFGFRKEEFGRFWGLKFIFN
jgi:hypothetical protein